jgi:hypothetical protein
MKKQKAILFTTALLLIGATAATVVWMQNHQKLGRPGIKATAIPGSVLMNFDLPERVGEFTSEKIPEDVTVTNMLPKDTSFAQRFYKAEDGFGVVGNIVLMGLDRTSIHKPQYCLPGQGWRIEKQDVIQIPVGGSGPYALPVAQWLLSRTVSRENGAVQEHGLYFFWFVADGEETTDHWQRMWWLTRDLVQKGVLQRWAYVSYFTICEPGQEELVAGRVKKLIAASVPEFQLPLNSGATVVARQ